MHFQHLEFVRGSPAKMLEEEKTAEITGPARKNRSKEKVKLISISQIYG